MTTTQEKISETPLHTLNGANTLALTTEIIQLYRACFSPLPWHETERTSPPSPTGCPAQQAKGDFAP